ncbi:MAG: TfoX/Sxy family protein [Geminicoccaceae bacterium]
MANDPEFVDFSLELLSPVGPVRAKRMFGGHGIFLDDMMIALIADDQLYLKTDDETKDRFETAGSEPFRYTKAQGQVSVMSYHTAPEAALDDAEEMRTWARLAVDAALRARAKRPAKRRASKR